MTAQGLCTCFPGSFSHTSHDCLLGLRVSIKSCLPRVVLLSTISPSLYSSWQHPAYLFTSCITMCNYSLCCLPDFYLYINSMRPHKVHLPYSQLSLSNWCLVKCQTSRNSKMFLKMKETHINVGNSSLNKAYQVPCL